MSGTNVVRGNCFKWNLYQLTLSPTSVAANTAAAQTFAFTGLNVNDYVDIKSIGTQQAGLAIGNSRVSAAGVLEVTFTNQVGSVVTPTASASYLLIHGISEYQPLQTAP